MVREKLREFLRVSNILFKNKNNLNLNWDTFYDKFLLKKIKINYFKISSKKWVEIDTYNDFKKLKKL